METTLQKEIKKLKNKLSKKSVYENFGQKEVDYLENKFGYSILIKDFENWCMNYTGKE